jgi:LuxR family maltose regulon positive regulatory protein
LERWLNGLPEEVVETRPALLLARGWILDLRVQLAGLERLLQQAETLLNSDSSTWPEAEVRSLGGEIDCLWSLLLLWGGEGQRAAERAQQGVERIPVEHAYAYSASLLALGMALGVTGRSSIGTQRLSEFVIGSRTLPAAATVRVLQGLGYLHILQGNYRQAAEWLRQFLKLSETARLTLSIAHAHWLLGRISYEWNETDTAIQHFLSAVDRRYAAHYVVFRDSVLVLALAYEGQGRSEKADDTLAELRRFAFETDSTHSSNEVESFRARLMLLRGDLASALSWSRTADPEAPRGWGIWVGSTALTKVRVLIAQETSASLREATGLLKELLADAESNHNIGRQIQFLAFLALAYEGQGHTDQALAALERAVLLARPGGFVRTFADLGPHMARLLSRLARRGVAPEYVAWVLTAFDASSPPDAEPALDPVRQVRQLSRDNLIEPLTQRESEVLLLLAQGSSNKEIAETLVISRYTVKNHTGSIYQKLGVSGRKQAVSKAETLGLLVE